MFYPSKTVSYSGNGYYRVLDLLDCFVTKEQLMESCEQNKDAELVDSINKNIKGKEVFVDNKKIPEYLKEEMCDAKGKKTNIPYNHDGYFVLEDIRAMPLISNWPNYAYHAVFNDNKGSIFALPLSKTFSQFVEFAETHRDEVEKERLRKQYESERIERNRQKAEADYKNFLIRKYGKNNANLILEGCIRLGFTQEMVKTSWGSPSDITRVTNALGTVECWIYGIGSYVYFRGGKVVQIID